jgi:hypothetical protein
MIGARIGPAAIALATMAACGGTEASTTPIPTPTTAPTPTPVPTARMTPAAGSITVPASIDATGTTDVSPALNAWIASQPDGSSLVFPDGSRYLLGGDAGLQLDGRSGLTLEGAGSTLLLRTNGVSNRSSAFFLQDSRHITIRGFTVDGGNEATGTTGAEAAFHEQMNGAVVRAGSAFVEFHGVTWDRLYGFGVFVGAEGGTAWPEDISIHDSTIRGGEMGVAVVAGRRIRIVGNTINDSVYYPVDLEPDISQPGPNGEPGHGGGFVDVLIADNDIARYGWGTDMTSWFVAAAPQDDVVDTAVMDGLTITGNRVHVGPAVPTGRYEEGLGGLGIRSDKANLKRNFTITDNWTADDDVRQVAAAVLNLRNVENLVVTGNRQPITGRATFLSDPGTTGTRVVDENDVSP